MTKKQEAVIMQNLEEEMKLAETKNERIIKLNNVRLSFPVLFEAKSFDDTPGSKKEFSASFLMSKEHPAVAELKAAFAKMATDKWGEKGPKLLGDLFRDDRLCLHDGDRKDYEGYSGSYFVRANNSVRPLTLDRARNPVTEQDGKLYSGCYVNATISLWTQDNKWGKRINATLRGVQFFADGEAFSGGGTASVDEFSASEEAAGQTNAALDAFGF